MTNSAIFGINMFDNNKMHERLSETLYDKILLGQNREVTFSDEELGERLNEAFTGLLTLVR